MRITGKSYVFYNVRVFILSCSRETSDWRWFILNVCTCKLLSQYCHRQTLVFLCFLAAFWSPIDQSGIAYLWQIKQTRIVDLKIWWIRKNVFSTPVYRSRPVKNTNKCGFDKSGLRKKTNCEHWKRKTWLNYQAGTQFFVL